MLPFDAILVLSIKKAKLDEKEPRVTYEKLFPLTMLPLPEYSRHCHN